MDYRIFILVLASIHVAMGCGCWGRKSRMDKEEELCGLFEHVVYKDCFKPDIYACLRLSNEEFNKKYNEIKKCIERIDKTGNIRNGWRLFGWGKRDDFIQWFLYKIYGPLFVRVPKAE
ncbi:unnamed protein product [Cylicocyclus nassatus]|uniref:Uncharacterized protein n=1 Tax=Cylicocyclus nassatus TaxID=53992 RepID=A0AA36GMU0_CYLNA|nr:unnamed protein product [Cylicocyclus nassatus]